MESGDAASYGAAGGKGRTPERELRWGVEGLLGFGVWGLGLGV